MGIKPTIFHWCDNIPYGTQLQLCFDTFIFCKKQAVELVAHVASHQINHSYRHKSRTVLILHTFITIGRDVAYPHPVRYSTWHLSAYIVDTICSVLSTPPLPSVSHSPLPPLYSPQTSSLPPHYLISMHSHRCSNTVNGVDMKMSFRENTCTS